MSVKIEVYTSTCGACNVIRASPRIWQSGYRLNLRRLRSPSYKQRGDSPPVTDHPFIQWGVKFFCLDQQLSIQQGFFGFFYDKL